MASFRKLSDGSWGVWIAPSESFGNGEDDGLGPNRAPIPGTVVAVSKRSGETQQITLGELVSSHPLNGWVFKIAPRVQAPAATQTQVGNLSSILTLFDRARAHLRYPAIVLSVPGTGTIRVSMAGDRARVPGSLNVTALDEFVDGRRRWFGRIRQNGVFESSTTTPRAIAARLQQFAANPAAVASVYGRLTGHCCFCNRPLEDERSTAVGYGPICADHYGLPWGERPTEFAAAPSQRGEGGEASYQQSDARADAA